MMFRNDKVHRRSSRCILGYPVGCMQFIHVHKTVTAEKQLPFILLKGDLVNRILDLVTISLHLSVFAN